MEGKEGRKEGTSRNPTKHEADTRAAADNTRKGLGRKGGKGRKEGREGRKGRKGGREEEKEGEQKDRQMMARRNAKRWTGGIEERLKGLRA
jgi:hypothetical protein